MAQLFSPRQDSVSTPFLDSPDLVFDKPESRKNVFKSLPALDSNYDQLDKELQQLSDSLGVLYEQEDSEIEFLDSFIDYDDISIIYKTVEDKEKSEKVTSVDDNEIVVVTDKDEEGTLEIVINGSEPSSKKTSREKWKWWKSKGRLILRSFSCNCFRGRCSAKPRSKYEVTAERRQEESGSEGTKEEEGGGEVVKVKSFHIQQEQATMKNIERPGPDTCGGYIEAVSELENLEKLILRDTLRETFLKRRGMETIREEAADLAFINLSYDMMKVDRSVLNNIYENLDQEKRIQNRYENVKFPLESGSTEETKDECYQYYENIPQQSTALRISNDDEYESYDFGEEGIYQNIMFTNGSSSIKGSDLNSIDALQQCINEVNDIIKVKPNDDQSEKVDVTLPKPTSSIKEEKAETKQAANTPPQKPVRSIPNNFKTWALSKAEHPKLDPNKLPRQKIVNTETFSLEERNIVGEFLKTFKEELKSN